MEFNMWSPLTVSGIHQRNRDSKSGLGSVENSWKDTLNKFQFDPTDGIHVETCLDISGKLSDKVSSFKVSGFFINIIISQYVF